MKRCLIFLCYILLNSAQGQEKLNTFFIIDSTSRLAVPSVSVAIVKAKLAITTEDDGIFNIPGDLGKMRDTLILSAQNYITLKLPLNKINGIDTIYLKRLTIDSASSRPDLRTDSLLNDFSRKDIVHYAGIHTETSLFAYLQLAQQFDVPRSGVLLRGLVVNRLAFIVGPDRAGLEVTTFRIRVYDIDSVTGGPGKDLCNQLIEIKDKDNRQFRVNLNQYNIILPNKTFFVAIEWLRDFRNMGYTMVYDEKLMRDVQLVNYRPTIGISPVKGSKLNIWAMDFKGQWKPYTYFSPDYTDLAIKARVAY